MPRDPTLAVFLLGMATDDNGLGRRKRHELLFQVFVRRAYAPSDSVKACHDIIREYM